MKEVIVFGNKLIELEFKQGEFVVSTLFDNLYKNSQSIVVPKFIQKTLEEAGAPINENGTEYSIRATHL